MPQKELFINSIRQVRIGGHTLVPTAVLYREKGYLVGYDAIEACDDPSQLREDFKVELGREDPVKISQQRDRSGWSPARSVLGIAKDFIDQVVDKAAKAVETQGLASPSKILVAEPLTLVDDELARDDWLRNYRAALKRILSGKFKQIDYLPEPFAVFQYYRYGVKHPLVAQKTRHVALVFDFGGGTFDASVIETTAAGDISNGGRNSRPLAAKSIPVGGYFINREIAEALLFKGIDKSVEKSAVRKALDAYSALKNADDDTLANHRTDHAAFVRHFRRLLQAVEQAKLSICSGIVDWRLSADLGSAPAARIDVPQKPLTDVSPMASLRLEADDIRQVFEGRVWKQKLLPSIHETLRRAETELGGKPISIVLLSGGSSNIRWLRPLIERDLGPALRRAEVLELSENFQEIVSKGLAVECARRFYNEGEGDFRAVTYNRLCLALDPNQGGVELRKFTPESEALEGMEPEAGVLLPSSTSLRNFVGQPLRWKVRLSRAPSQSLDYYFMRSSFDHEDMKARHNIESRTVTPRDASFGGSIGVELVVREDGTAEPTFIYGRGTQARARSVAGKPFYMDMTYAAEESVGNAYIGLDFGTSTSSICYVDASDVRVYAERSADKTWLGLSSLVEVLPYPIAFPLARYLSETAAEQMDARGREALEAMLTFSAYVAYAEHCAVGGAGGGALKGMRQRSAGPLWAMIKQCATMTGKSWVHASALLDLATSPLEQELDSAISKIALAKHGKLAPDIPYARLLEMFGNVISRCMEGKVFGYFDESKKKPFSMKEVQGIFRSASGPSTTFIDIFEYEGVESFPSEFLFLTDIESGSALPLFPLMVRGLGGGGPRGAGPDIYYFDIARRDEVAYRAVQERDEVVVSANGAFAELFSEMGGVLHADRQVVPIRGLKIRSRKVEA